MIEKMICEERIIHWSGPGIADISTACGFHGCAAVQYTGLDIDVNCPACVQAHDEWKEFFKNKKK